MKITIKINDAKVVLKAQSPEEIDALGPLVVSIVEGAFADMSKGSKVKATAETGIDSRLAKSRMETIEWILSTNAKPMNAPEISAEAKKFPDFYTKGGDPVHIVRRVLAEGVASEKVRKTPNGLFVSSDLDNWNPSLLEEHISDVSRIMKATIRKEDVLDASPHLGEYKVVLQKEDLVDPFAGH